MLIYNVILYTFIKYIFFSSLIATRTTSVCDMTK